MHWNTHFYFLILFTFYFLLASEQIPALIASLIPVQVKSIFQTHSRKERRSENPNGSFTYLRFFFRGGIVLRWRTFCPTQGKRGGSLRGWGRRGVWNKKHISYRKKLVQNEKSPPAYHVEFTQCASGLVSIILLLLFQLPLYISFYKRRYHKVSYCGGHHFSDTQNIFGS